MEHSHHCMFFYCSRGEKGARTSYGNCKTRGEGTRHKVLRPSSTKQTSSREESTAPMIAAPLTRRQSNAEKCPKAPSGNHFKTWSILVPPQKLQDILPLCSFAQFTWCYEWTGTKSQLLASVPGLLLSCNLGVIRLKGLALRTFQAAVVWVWVNCLMLAGSSQCMTVIRWHQRCSQLTVDITIMFCFFSDFSCFVDLS